jgi:DNA repair exonuclease SbcCD nuclease subunit/DNA repair exonuclease SbcCD ATPase subunit
MATKKSLLILANTLGINENLKNKNKESIKEAIKNFKLVSKKNNILQQGKIIKTIYHTADLHIRTLERHQEYRQVFENLYQKLKERNNENSVLVISGDIFHSRDRLTSETIILFNEFIEKMTSAIDTVAILGNHDIYQNNTRLDMLSGILTLKTPENFYFLKESGIYKYNNISFYVSSLYDNKFLRCPKTPEKDQITVSLFHGTVGEAKLDNGTNIKDATIKLSDFNGFDYALLGDIHRRQHLKLNIAYPGSLIQQNFGEEIGHGILEWELTNKTCKFIEIENEHSFRTITDFKNIKDIKFTKKSSIRLQHSYFENINFEEIRNEISKYTEIKSFVKEIKEQEIKGQEAIVPLNKTDHFLNILNKKGYPNETIISLKELHLKETKSVILNSKQNESWSIETLEFKNVFIYGNDHSNKINFNKMNGIIGILGDNAIGKSAIFNIIIYTLFGGIFKSKNTINTNIINKNAKNYEIKMTISSGLNVFEIQRSGKNRKRPNGDTGMDETILFYENGVSVENSKLETSKLIKEKLGLTTKDNFILTNVLSYTNYISPIGMSSTDLSSKLNELFNLGIYTEIYQKTLKSIKVITDKIKLLNLDITNESSIVSNEDEITISLNKFKLIQNDLNKEIEQNELLIQQVILQEIELGPIYSKTENYTKEQLELLRENIVSTKETKEELKIKLAILPKCYTNFNPIETQKSLSILQNEYQELNKLFKPINKMITEKEHSKILKKERYDPNLFINELGNLKDTQLPQDLFDDIIDFFGELSSNEYLNDAIALIDYANILYNNNLTNQIGIIKSNINFNILKETEKINSHIENCCNLELIKKIEDYLLNENNINIKERLKIEKEKLNNKKHLLNKELTRVNKLLTENEIQLKTIQTSKEKLIKMRKQNEDLLKQEKVLQLYKETIKILPKKILYDTTQAIEKFANNLIYKMTGLYICLNETDNNWEILVKKEKMLLGTEHLSGYERFIVNVVLKLTLDKFKYYDKANFFIIDEVIDASSNENIVSKMENLFNVLKSCYKVILVISHNENLKNQMDHIINIESNSVCSRIV